MMLIRNDIPHRRRDDLECNLEQLGHKIQLMILECHVRSQKWYIITLYKLPKIRNHNFIDFMSHMYDLIIPESNEIICFGDFNIDMLTNNSISDNICNVYSVHNVIDGPTCFKSSRGTLIDPVLVTNKRRISTSFNIKCGFSDWHNIVGCVTKIQVPKQIPTKIKYRSYKNFDDNTFRNDVAFIPFHVCEIFDDVDDQYDIYTKLLTDVLDDHAPIKTKMLRKPQVPYMNSRLRKEMYHRNRLKNAYFKYRTGSLWVAYKKQRNKVTNLRKLSIKKYFESRCKSDENNHGVDFWKTIKPFITDKIPGNDNIILCQDSDIISKQHDVAEVLNSYFSTIADNIGVPDELPDDDFNSVLNEHRSHPSIVAIQTHNHNASFDFSMCSDLDICKALQKLNIKKSTGYDNLPPKIMKMCSLELSNSFCTLINECIKKNKFPSGMKKAEVAPIFKKKDRLCKENYRPVSVLPILSKVFENVLSVQLTKFFDNIFNDMLSAYRKKYSCQSVLLKLTETWRTALDNNMYIGAVMADLSRAFDSMPHKLLICKLHAYGLSHDACQMIASYLKDRQQRVN